MIVIIAQYVHNSNLEHMVGNADWVRSEIKEFTKLTISSTCYFLVFLCCVSLLAIYRLIVVPIQELQQNICYPQNKEVVQKFLKRMAKVRADEDFKNQKRIDKLEFERGVRNRKILRDLHKKALQGKVRALVVRQHIEDM